MTAKPRITLAGPEGKRRIHLDEGQQIIIDHADELARIAHIPKKHQTQWRGWMLNSLTCYGKGNLRAQDDWNTDRIALRLLRSGMDQRDLARQIGETFGPKGYFAQCIQEINGTWALPIAHMGYETWKSNIDDVWSIDPHARIWNDIQSPRDTHVKELIGAWAAAKTHALGLDPEEATQRYFDNCMYGFYFTP